MIIPHSEYITHIAQKGDPGEASRPAPAPEETKAPKEAKAPLPPRASISCGARGRTSQQPPGRLW